MSDSSLQNETIRKSIHLFMAILPIIYLFYLNREQMAVLCISLFALFLLADILRRYITHLTQIYEKIFVKLMRPHEKGRMFNGATLLIAGFAITVIVFEKEVAIVAMLILALSDGLATIIGMRYGRKRWFGKTLEGSIAFFAVTLIISSFFIDNFGINILGATLITIVELISAKLNDNLTIPLVSGLFFTLAQDYLAG